MRYVVVLALVVAVAPPGFAQSTDAQAESLFRQGREFLAAGRVAEACTAFDASQKLAPAITTQLNQAACREKNRQFASAWGIFVEVARATRSATDEEHAQFKRVAAERAAKLEPILSTLTIEVPASVRIEGLGVMRGDVAVGIGEWSLPLPIDGGSYTITASAPGHETWTATVTVSSELDGKTVKVPVLAPIRRIAQPPPVPPRSRMPLVVGASALVAGGLALGFELWGRSTYGRAEREADNALQRELVDSANVKRHVAQAFGIAGLATAGVAAWFHVKDRRERRRAVAVQPVLGPDGAAITVGGVW